MPHAFLCNINTFLRRKNTLGNLYSHSLEIIKLQKIICDTLGEPLSNHIHLSDVNSDTLLLYTDSPIWAAKLRFSATEIIKIVNQFTNFQKVTTIRVKINPSLCIVTDSENRILISSSTAEHLEKVAENINDYEIKSSLLKLAQNR
ncbi:MAG: hypothetical protein ACI9XC_002438 [Gammaproteobacteria bacterium]|jgi:hypothetical protein